MVIYIRNNLQLTTLSMQLMNLDTPLLKFSNNPQDFWTLRDAVRGTQIFGGIGSGKSTGSGQTLALAYLKKGYGGLVLTGKIDETNQWIEYAKRTGRQDDLIIFSPGKGMQFNPLEYELQRKDEGGGETDNLVSLFTSIMQMGNRTGTGGGQGKSNDPFWELAMQRCLKASIDILKLSNQDITVENITKVISEAPRGNDCFSNFNSLVDSQDSEDANLLTDWCSKSFTVYCLAWASYNQMNEPESMVYNVVKGYFLADFASLSENTRSSITEQFYAFANPFRSGMLADHFAKNTSEYLKPENTFEGKIIVLDFPVKKYLQLGVYAQAIYKMIWQQAVERRDTERFPKPLFLWIDEAQYFVNEYDMLFQTTARSSLACSVLISQNISNYYATIGGEMAKERVNSLLGNLATKIFHSNNDYVTNQWAADTIGKTFQKKTSISVGDLSNTSINRGLEYQVEPQQFTLLQGGGELNGNRAEAIITVAGKRWSTGDNYLETFFNQNIVLA